MSGLAMIVIGVAVFALPVVLVLVFHRDDRADARGRRVSRRWHT